MSRNFDGMMAVVQTALRLNIIENYYSDVGHDAGMLLGEDAPNQFVWYIYSHGTHTARLDSDTFVQDVLNIHDNFGRDYAGKWFFWNGRDFLECSKVGDAITRAFTFKLELAEKVKQLALLEEQEAERLKLIAEEKAREDDLIPSCKSANDARYRYQLDDEQITKCVDCGKEVWCSFASDPDVTAHYCHDCNIRM